MKTRKTLNCLATAAALVATFTLATPANASDTRAILERFVEDYRSDMMAIPGTFAIKVDETWWHVVTEGEPGVPSSVALHEGAPSEPTFYYWMDAATLDRLDKGTLNPGTAMVKAFSTDVSPMDADVMEGYQPDEAFLESLLRVTFHFWIRGFPEIIPFAEDHTRFTHGADGVIFYYQPGLRSGWFSVKKGQHVNSDPRSQTNPFPTLFIVTEGKGIGKIGGKEVELEAGQSMYIPATVTHEFWNHNDEPFRGIIMMFGDGA
jgi:mannose-6-phosphate isomerase-like protein (cupin superfamily)